MTDIPIHFAVDSYKARSGIFSSERLVNLYAEINPKEDGAFKVALYGTPGLNLWKNFEMFSPIYGVEMMGDDTYWVCGITVIKVDVNKNVTVIGTMGATPGRVMMTNNGTQVTILAESGIAYYCTSSPGSVTQITDPDFESSNSITNMDGFTISTLKGSRRFQISELNDTSSYLALDFATVEATSDDIVRGISNNLELWFFKEKSTEVYYNSGNADFPFERKNGVFIQKGCAAKYSVSIFDNSFYFLGDDRVIYRTAGYQLQPISTFPISKEIESYSKVDDAFSFVYVQDGHKFFSITFPTAKKTWVYDITQNLWHERESLNPSNNIAQQWRANNFVCFAGKNLVGDANTGKIYELDLDTYEEDGTPLIAKAISATQFDSYNRDSVGTLVAVMDTGVGISYGQGDNPEIMMKTSVDGGKTWSNEMWQPIGKIGSYETEVFWNKVAYGRSLITEVKISDPVKRAFVGFYLEVDQGD